MTDVIKRTKKSFLGGGIVLILLGAGAIALPLVASLAIEAIFGWIFAISGVVTIAHSFNALNSGKCFLRLLSGIFYLAIGIMFLAYPIQGVATLTLLLAILFTFQGIIKIAVAIRLRPIANWSWMLVSGIASLVISGIIWAGWPSSVAWVLGLLVGINLMLSGFTMLMLASSK